MFWRCGEHEDKAGINKANAAEAAGNNLGGPQGIPQAGRPEKLRQPKYRYRPRRRENLTGTYEDAARRPLSP